MASKITSPRGLHRPRPKEPLYYVKTSTYTSPEHDLRTPSPEGQAARPSSIPHLALLRIPFLRYIYIIYIRTPLGGALRAVRFPFALRAQGKRPPKTPSTSASRSFFLQGKDSQYIIIIYYFLRLHFNVDFIDRKSKILGIFQKIPAGNFPKKFRTRAGIRK